MNYLNLYAMKKILKIRLIWIICSVSFITSYNFGQDKLGWLDDYSGDVAAGSYNYKYSYSAMDNNSCKIKIEEEKSDKKGNSTIKSYVFYLSDLEPSAINFKTSGASVLVTLATKSAQKFISAYANDALEEYTNSITIYFDAIDKARSYIEAFKSQCESCKSSDLSWESREDAFNWLSKNIGESNNSGTQVKQSFSKGPQSHMATLTVEKTDSKGTNQVVNLFDLSDLDPKGILLKVSGKILKIDLPVKNNEYFIQTNTNGQTIAYEKSAEIFSDDLEIARNLINAMSYLVSSTKPQRTEWKEYSVAMGFLRDNLSELMVGTNKISQSLSFENSSSGLASFKVLETDAKGIESEELNLFYLIDLNPAIKLEVTSKNAYLLIETKDKNKFIKQTREDKTSAYVNSVKLYVEQIDKGRDFITALEFAIKNSTAGVQEFTALQKAIDWLAQNAGDVTIDTKSYHQTIQVNTNLENQIDLNVITSDASGTSINERYEIYPEDISREELKIKVSGKKLSVPLSTGKNKYIKFFSGESQQSYITETELLFEDIRQAKNFIVAMSLIQEKSKVADRSMKDNTTAYAFLESTIQPVEIAGIKRDQKIEQQESDECNLKYSMTQTDSKGVATEYSYEFMLTDVDPAKSIIVISGKDVKVNLITHAKQKLIKPYKNGEVGAFIYDVDIICDDVLIAKKLLAAFVTLSKGCK
jgi:hypothetical protein